MARITVETENCDQENPFIIEELSDASICLKIEFDEIVSAQSQAERKRELIQEIQRELSRFTWVIAGIVQIEFAWYLHRVHRQETDKIGDLDNITKPVQDALAGALGVLIDDSQINSNHTCWRSRNEQVTYSVLVLDLRFSNDECLFKENLFFIQYWNAMCVAINVDFSDHKSIIGAIFVIRARKLHRFLGNHLDRLSPSTGRQMILTTWDFHRTRVNGFPWEMILSLVQFKKRASDAGITWKILRQSVRAFGPRGLFGKLKHSLGKLNQPK
ncbi:hypothetical protein PS3A_37680 [Pseudomonas sp. 3A(2025)]